MDIIEKMLEQIPTINTMYFWIFFLMVVIFVNKIEISNENIKEKMILSYLLLLILRYVHIISIPFAIIFSIIIYFIFIELFYLSENDKKILNKWSFYLYDFAYKLIFKYYYHVFILSLFVTSNKLYNFLLPYYLKTKVPFELYYLLVALSILLYLYNISLILKNSFETLSIGEITEKIEKILPFAHYKHDKRLEDFATILTYYEDKSFFKRKNSFNWLSIPFIKYKFNRIKSNRKNKIYSIKIIGPVLKFIITTIIMICKTVKLVCTNMYKIIKVLFNKLFSKNKIRNIRNVIGGYSTIEMQLIRTLANTSGYNKLIHRKVYEIIYSQIFFKSLYNYFKYYHYQNLKEEYRYYLINLYILCAPTFINGKRYNNINKLYKNRKDILEITNEEFYVYCLGLANKKISDRIIEYNTSPIKLEKKYLENVLYEIGYKPYPMLPSTKKGLPIDIMLYDYKSRKSFPVKLYFEPNKTLKSIVDYIQMVYCKKDTIAYIENINEILYGGTIEEDKLDKFSINGRNTSYQHPFIETCINDIYERIREKNIIINILFNIEYGMGSTSGITHTIRYVLSKDDSIKNPFVRCIYNKEKIKVDLYDYSTLNGENFKSIVMTRKAIQYVKDNENMFLQLWDEIIDEDNKKDVQVEVYI